MGPKMGRTGCRAIGVRVGVDERRATAHDPWVGSNRVVQVRPQYGSWLAAQQVEGPVLEVGPGLRPTAAVPQSFFVDLSPHALTELAARGARTEGRDLNWQRAGVAACRAAPGANRHPLVPKEME